MWTDGRASSEADRSAGRFALRHLLSPEMNPVRVEGGPLIVASGVWQRRAQVWCGVLERHFHYLGWPDSTPPGHPCNSLRNAWTRGLIVTLRPSVRWAVTGEQEGMTQGRSVYLRFLRTSGILHACSTVPFVCVRPNFNVDAGNDVPQFAAA